MTWEQLHDEIGKATEALGKIPKLDQLVRPTIQATIRCVRDLSGRYADHTDEAVRWIVAGELKKIGMLLPEPRLFTFFRLSCANDWICGILAPLPRAMPEPASRTRAELMQWLLHTTWRQWNRDRWLNLVALQAFTGASTVHGGEGHRGLHG